MTNEEEIERAHMLDGYGDTMFPDLACNNPDFCSCPEDYPGWDKSMGCVPAPVPKTAAAPTRRQRIAASWRELWATPLAFRAFSSLSALWAGFAIGAEVWQGDLWQALVFAATSAMWGVVAYLSLRKDRDDRG